MRMIIINNHHHFVIISFISTIINVLKFIISPRIDNFLVEIPFMNWIKKACRKQHIPKVKNIFQSNN